MSNVFSHSETPYAHLWAAHLHRLHQLDFLSIVAFGLLQSMGGKRSWGIFSLLPPTSAAPSLMSWFTCVHSPQVHPSYTNTYEEAFVCVLNYPLYLLCFPVSWVLTVSPVHGLMLLAFPRTPLWTILLVRNQVWFWCLQHLCSIQLTR